MRSTPEPSRLRLGRPWREVRREEEVAGEGENVRIQDPSHDCHRKVSVHTSHVRTVVHDTCELTTLNPSNRTSSSRNYNIFHWQHQEITYSEVQVAEEEAARTHHFQGQPREVLPSSSSTSLRSES